MTTLDSVLTLLAISLYSLAFVFACDVGRRLRLPGVAIIGAAILLRMGTVVLSLFRERYDDFPALLLTERVYCPLAVAFLAALGFARLSFELRRTWISMPRERG